MCDVNGGIGYQGRLPWNIPEELAFFKKQTLNHSVLMGRKTFNSLKEPLKQRKNYIITKDSSFKCSKATVLKNDEEIKSIVNKYKNSNDTLFVIGGVSTYMLLKKHADEIILTRICHEYDCDTYVDLDYLLHGFKHTPRKDILLSNSQDLDIVVEFWNK